MSKRVGVMIPHPEVWKKFSKFVEQNWGKKHSMMGLELEQALKEYMREHAHTHAHTQKAGSSKK